MDIGLHHNQYITIIKTCELENFKNESSHKFDRMLKQNNIKNIVF